MSSNWIHIISPPSPFTIRQRIRRNMAKIYDGWRPVEVSASAEEELEEVMGRGGQELARRWWKGWLDVLRLVADKSRITDPTSDAQTWLFRHARRRWGSRSASARGRKVDNRCNLYVNVSAVRIRLRRLRESYDLTPDPPLHPPPAPAAGTRRFVVPPTDCWRINARSPARPSIRVIRVYVFARKSLTCVLQGTCTGSPHMWIRSHDHRICESIDVVWIRPQDRSHVNPVTWSSHMWIHRWCVNQTARSLACENSTGPPHTPTQTHVKPQRTYVVDPHSFPSYI